MTPTSARPYSMGISRINSPRGRIRSRSRSRRRLRGRDSRYSQKMSMRGWWGSSRKRAWNVFHCSSLMRSQCIPNLYWFRFIGLSTSSIWDISVYQVIHFTWLDWQTQTCCTSAQPASRVWISSIPTTFGGSVAQLASALNGTCPQSTSSLCDREASSENNRT